MNKVGRLFVGIERIDRPTVIRVLDANGPLLEKSYIDKKVLADDIVTARAARSGENIPLIVSIPKQIAEIMKI